MSVPPLRERRDDSERFVRHFATKYAERMRKRIVSIPKATMDALKNHSWPGNVRESPNLMERAVLVVSWAGITSSLDRCSCSFRDNG